jgi:hypothetical protein
MFKNVIFINITMRYLGICMCSNTYVVSVAECLEIKEKIIIQ